MTETYCDVCGDAIPRAGILTAKVDDTVLAGDGGTAPRRCSSCGHIQTRGHLGSLEALRQAIDRLDSVIGFLLLLMLAGMVAIYIVAPLSAAFGFFREGERLRPILLTVLVGSFVVLGVRSAVRHELGPAVAAAGIAVLLLVVWVAWRAR
jgi:hypothetical protein